MVGIADEKWGEKIVAAVVKAFGADVGENQIRAYCKKHLHDWKCPKVIFFVNELPRNIMGKVLAKEVKKLLWTQIFCGDPVSFCPFDLCGDIHFGFGWTKAQTYGPRSLIR